jgi:flagellar protein FlgJ
MINPSSLLFSPLPSLDRADLSAASPPARDAQAAQETATQFESVFLSLLLKEMRQTQQGDGLFAGESSDTYGGMFDLYVGDHLAKSGGLGIARLVTESIERMKTVTPP